MSNSFNEIAVIPLRNELLFEVFGNTKLCCFLAQMLKFKAQSQCAEYLNFALMGRKKKLSGFKLMAITPVVSKIVLNKKMYA